MKNLIIAGIAALSGMFSNSAEKPFKNKKCECASCYIKKLGNQRIRRKRKESESKKNQEKRNEEL